jgi:hypothetical protein
MLSRLRCARLRAARPLPVDVAAGPLGAERHYIVQCRSTWQLARKLEIHQPTLLRKNAHPTGMNLYENTAYRHQGATNYTSSSNPRAGKMGDVLDALSSGIAKIAASEPKTEPQFLVPDVPAEPASQLLTEKMLADRWVCLVARLQRWRTVGEGPQYLKIVGKVLYRLTDIEAYEEACLIRKAF